MRGSFVLALPLLVVASCAAPSGDDPDTDEIEVDDGKADAELRVRVDGVTVWVDPEIVRTDGARPWRLGGRASRNLAAVSGSAGEDALGAVTIASARTFEIALADAELRTLASGLPLFVAITPTTGDPAAAAIWLAPKLGRFEGTSKLRVDITVTPRWVAGEPIFRGGARAEPGWSLFVEGDRAPQVFAEPDRRFRLDWTFDKFATGVAAPFDLRVQNGDQVADKRASARFVTRRLGLTRLDPTDVWRERCEASVRACVEGLPAGTADAAACGSFRQVTACGGLDVAATPTTARAATDLRAYLVAYYAAHPDVPASGGNSLAAAQAAVDPAAFELVTDPDEDPYGHDLGQFWIYRHPDVMFPGSDIVWFVAYDKASGQLAEVYEFN